MDSEPKRLGGVEISRGDTHKPLFVWVERRGDRWVVCAPHGIPLVTSRSDIATGWHRTTAEEYAGGDAEVDAIELRTYCYGETVIFEGHRETETPEDASATG
jgi:hypothetical protein